ncbi:MAG: DUF4169 family protein [Cohaesibacteraceae bacterium]|nr:DUF4169 family protein [Cohaesibacteraceae bacterium]
MAEMFNLRDERKKRDAQKKQLKASQNRIKFGRTKGQKNQEELEATRSRAKLEAHVIDSDEPVTKDPL